MEVSKFNAWAVIQSVLAATLIAILTWIATSFDNQRSYISDIQLELARRQLIVDSFYDEFQNLKTISENRRQEAFKENLKQWEQIEDLIRRDAKRDAMEFRLEDLEKEIEKCCVSK